MISHCPGPNLATLSLLAPVQLTLSLASEVKNSRDRPGNGAVAGERSKNAGEIQKAWMIWMGFTYEYL